MAAENVIFPQVLVFLDHMLEQIGKHGGIDLTIKVKW